MYDPEIANIFAVVGTRESARTQNLTRGRFANFSIHNMPHKHIKPYINKIWWEKI